MKNVIIKEPFSAHNPYVKTPLSDLLSWLGGRRVSLGEGDPLIEFSNWISDVIPFSNYERKVDFVGNTALALDLGVFGTIVGIQGATIGNNLLHLNLQKYPILGNIPHILRVMTLPLSIFFVAMGLIEGFVELVNIRRVASLLTHVQNNKEAPVRVLEVIKDNYFSLNPEEVAKIKAFIEAKLPPLTHAQKRLQFDHIAKKALKIKYEGFKRRITPGIAKEVKQQLNPILRDLNSWDSKKRALAETKAQILMKSVEHQAKTKIVIHMLAFSAIALSLVSASLSGIKLGGLPVIFSLGAIITALVFMKYVLKFGPLTKEIEELQHKLKHLPTTNPS